MQALLSSIIVSSQGNMTGIRRNRVRRSLFVQKPICVPSTDGKLQTCSNTSEFYSRPLHRMIQGIHANTGDQQSFDCHLKIELLSDRTLRSTQHIELRF
jgi:hypothetical protein